MEFVYLMINPNILLVIITSYIYECNMVETAFIILSTFGFEMVEAANMVFMVDAFLSSISIIVLIKLF